MPTTQKYIYCCKHGEAFDDFFIGGCDVSPYSVENIQSTVYNGGYLTFPNTVVTGLTCGEIVCRNGNTSAHIVVGCVPSGMLSNSPMYVKVDFDIYKNGSPFAGGSGRSVEIRSGQPCPEGTCPEICT